MKKAVKFISLVLIIFFAIIAFFAIRDKLDLRVEEEADMEKTETREPEYKTYTSAVYKFSLSFPEGYEAVETSPQEINIVREGYRADVATSIYLIRSGPDSGIQSFEEFVLDQSRLLCSAESANNSVECTRIDDVVRIAPFVSAKGISGQVFYLKAFEISSTLGKKVETRRGPFYTFNTSASTPNEMSFVSVGNPIIRKADQANTKLIEEIAKSFDFKP